MNYYDKENNRFLNIVEVRQLHPNMSIPDGANLEHLGYVKIEIYPAPEYDEIFEVLEKVFFEEQRVLAFVKRSKTDQEISNESGKILEKLSEKISIACQEKLDDFARQKGYDNIVSLCSYKDDPDEEFRNEAQIGLTKRSEMWKTVKRIRSEVLLGLRPIPKSLADIEQELPQLIWS